MKRTLLTSIAFFSCLGSAGAHDPSATYIANEGVLITNGEIKIMFDPLFNEGFGIYQAVPKDTRAKMMAGEAPFDGVDAVFISHAHGDHFAANEVADYLEAQTDVTLFAPQQAVDKLMLAANPESDISSRVIAFSLDVGDTPQMKTTGDINVEAVRIHQSGNRPTIENTVFRVTLNDEVTVMHMGDANNDIRTYAPHKAHWQARRTDMAFPPYWLLLDDNGRFIIEYMNITKAVGAHVPIKVPSELKASGGDYFSQPGEVRVISGGHSHD